MWYGINDTLANHGYSRQCPRLHFQGSGWEGIDLDNFVISYLLVLTNKINYSKHLSKNSLRYQLSYVNSS